MSNPSLNILVSEVSGNYHLHATIEWEGEASFVNDGQTIPTEPNEEGIFELILKIAENAEEGSNVVEHAFSLEPMGIRPPEDFQIEVIWMEGETEHGRNIVNQASAKEYSK